MSMDILRKQIVYVSSEYPDSSRYIFRTTLNKDILKEFGGNVKPDSLYDLDRKSYYNLDNKKIKISLEKPQLSGVEEFMEQFL